MGCHHPTPGGLSSRPSLFFALEGNFLVKRRDPWLEKEIPVYIYMQRKRPPEWHQKRINKYSYIYETCFPNLYTRCTHCITWIQPARGQSRHNRVARYSTCCTFLVCCVCQVLTWKDDAGENIRCWMNRPTMQTLDVLHLCATVLSWYRFSYTPTRFPYVWDQVTVDFLTPQAFIAHTPTNPLGCRDGAA